ncbi:MAG TPA: alpha/beta hydrolase [Dehalococcoidia bacterium]|nr:alpha/beta hydrolase [Dehalococcoidia bacterium]
MDDQVVQALRPFKAMMERGFSRDEVLALRSPASAPAPEGVQVADVDAGGVPAEWLTPAEHGAAVILYAHGGGYVIGSRAADRDLVGLLVRAAGARAVSIDYRLAPEHPFPAALDDTVAAYRWLLAEGVPPARIIVVGSSAGGGLALAALTVLRDAGQPLPAGVVTISAWLDLALSGDSASTRAASDPMFAVPGLRSVADMYLDGVDPRHPLASPLFADLRDLPPLLLQVGTAEVLHDDTIRVAEAARGAGIDVTVEVYEGMPHVFHKLLPAAGETQKAISSIGDFVRARAAATPSRSAS